MAFALSKGSSINSTASSSPPASTFAKTGTPVPIIGRDGRVLAQEWKSGARAYKSIAVSGYPNLYFTFGPNSGPGHSSALVYMEAQLDYLAQAIKIVLRARPQGTRCSSRCRRCVQRRVAASAVEDHVELGMFELVSHRRRIQCHYVSRFRDPVREPIEIGGSSGLHEHGARERHRADLIPGSDRPGCCH